MRFERYDLIAEWYPSMWPLLVPGYVPILNAIVDVVRALGHRPKDLLDLGCGPGTATVAVAPAADPDGLVTLVDGSPRMLDEAKRILGHHVRCTFQGDFNDAAVLRDACPANTYDLALCTFALHHLADIDKRRLLDGVGASLKKGGMLLLADEIAVDRPAGWDVIERVRGRVIDEHVRNGRINREFWELESNLAPEFALPFRPARIEDLTSYMAGAGLAVSCPVHIFGSALLIGIRPR